MKEESTFVCIRECVTFNKHFMPGDGFPENWYKQGYKPNRHFAHKKEAFDALEESKGERTLFTHGDDRRSTKQIRSELEKFVSDVPENWNRKQMWLELRRYEAADAREAPKSRKKG
jgi:hypothetical protein